MIRTVLVVFLVLLMIGMLPLWPYSHSWGFGYYPSGTLLLLLVLAVVFLGDGRRSLV